MLNVCVFSRAVPQHGIHGGMERHLQQIGEGLVANGHRLTVITTRHPHGMACEQTPWGEVHYVPHTRPAAYWPRFFEGGWKVFRKLHALRSFHVVVSEGAGAERYARLKDRYPLPPLVSIMHGTLWAELESHRHVLASVRNMLHTLRYFPPLLHHALLWQSYVRNADRLVAVSTEVRRRLLSEYHSDPTRICVVPNGIDTERFKPDVEARERIRGLFGLSERDALVMVVGRLTPEKGTGLAIAALRSLLDGGRQLRLAIVGDGPDRPRLENSAKAQGLVRQVVFCGYVPNERIPGYLSAADVLLMPTLRAEGFPFALVEAMACAKAPVVSSYRGVADIVTDGQDGLIVPPGDVGALISATKLLLDDSTLRQRLGRAARKRVLDRFSLDTMIRDTLAIIEECAASDWDQTG